MPIKRKLFLCVTVLAFFSLFLLNLSADSSQGVDFPDGFSFEDFTSENATLLNDEDGNLKMIFSRVAPMLSLNVLPDTLSSAHNAVRLTLTNNSACNSLFFTYWYTDGDGVIQSQTEKISLASRGALSDYYVYTDVVGQITQISLSFSGISSGSIVVKSIEGLCLYDASENSFGVLNSCTYDRERGRIEISGNVNYEFVTRYRKARLVLYALDMEIANLPYGSIPLASLPMSSHFDFLLSDVSFEDRMKGYVVAIVGEDGELLYALEPRIPSSKTEAKYEDGFQKGIHSEFGVLAARANAKLAVVDVDLERLVSDKPGEGQLYALAGRSFYFNRQYVSFLDSEVRKTHQNGMRVLLRLMSSTPSMGLADSSEEVFCLYAYAEFLCNRYSSSARGVVSGIIYGTCADVTRLSEITLEEYTRLYADSLFALSEAAASAEREIQLIVPISDCLEKEKGEISPRVFLVSLGNALRQRYSENIRVGIMVEGRALSGEGAPDGALGFENIAEISAFLKRLNDAYPTLSEEYLYYWSPTKITDRELLKASLLHGYYALACESQARGFILSTEAIQDLSLVEELMSIFQFSDTKRGEKNSILALGHLRVEDWSNLIEGYSREKIPQTEYRESTDVTTPPFHFLGEYYLWDFSQMGNNYGWSMGDGCESLVMEKNQETDRALAIKMHPLSENNYESELVYYFDKERAFDTVDAFSFVFSVDAPNGKYRITVQICSNTAMSEATLLLSSDELSKMYVNTAGMFEGEAVRCIRIFVTPVGGLLDEYKLLIGSISALSTTQRTEQLMESIKPKQDFYIQNEVMPTVEPFWIYTIVLVSFVSVILIVALRFKGEEET